MYCPNCGQSLADGAMFCGNCGASLVSPPKPKKKLGWLLAIILGLLLAGSVTVFLLWFFGDARAYKQAQKLYQQGDYVQAESAFRKLGSYEDSALQVQACRYQQGMGYFSQGHYELAEQIFASLNGYSDSAEQIKACRYQRALAAFQREDLAAAEELFAGLGDYKDSADWLVKCRPVNPVGTWDLIHLYSDGKDYAEELRQVGAEAYIVLAEDGTGFLYLVDEYVTLTWTEDRIIDESGAYMTLTVEGETLTIEDEENTVVFTRRSTEALPLPAAPSGNGGGTASDGGYSLLSGEVYWKLENGVLTITGKGEMDLGYDASQVPWYNSRDSILRVEIRDGVTSIGYSAFSGYENLVSVSIPSSVVRIESYAFENCYGLSSVVIPEGVVYLGDMAFDFCTGMKSLSIPASVREVGYLCFSGCESLTEIKLGAGSPIYTLVDGVLFSKDQKTLVLYPAAKPGSSYTVPKGVTVIGNNAFDSNRNLTEIELPEGLEEIGAWSFSATEMLDSLRLPEGLRAIGAYAFAFGTLKSLRIPTSVKTIGDMAFSFCFGLNDIYYAGSEAQWNAIQFDNADDASPDASLHFNAK